MAQETEPSASEQIPLTGIYLDFGSKSLILASEQGIVATVRLAPKGVVFERRSQAVTPAQSIELPAQVESVREPEATAERDKPVTLQGKLKNKPRSGRPDRTGKPTAWARFAAHEEDREGAHMYSTTFHRHTAEIALTLESGASLTVQGYPHETDDPAGKRMDTLSVINLLDYPGKAGK